ncbi:MAG: hypothetical protein R2702_03370 [Acidimicrobiales bacterium]
MERLVQVAGAERPDVWTLGEQLEQAVAVAQGEPGVRARPQGRVVGEQQRGVTGVVGERGAGGVDVDGPVDLAGHPRRQRHDAPAVGGERARRAEHPLDGLVEVVVAGEGHDGRIEAGDRGGDPLERGHRAVVGEVAGEGDRVGRHPQRAAHGEYGSAQGVVLGADAGPEVRVGELDHDSHPSSVPRSAREEGP